MQSNSINRESEAHREFETEKSRKFENVPFPSFPASSSTILFISNMFTMTFEKNRLFRSAAKVEKKNVTLLTLSNGEKKPRGKEGPFLHIRSCLEYCIYTPFQSIVERS